MKTNDLIRVQEADFDISEHYHQLRQINPAGTGAVVVFVGLVRDLDDAKLEAMELEHYPGMTESCLEHIVSEAHSRWSLEGVHVVHRVGKLLRHEQIVMDYLKQDAPFWKAEFTEQGKRWVQVKASDQQAGKRW
jgi:molybdopterin synthase catalytic subunit